MIILLLLLFFPITAHAAARDIRISDGDGHVLQLDSNGKPTFSTVNEGCAASGGAKDMRISDNDGDVLKVNSDCSITITTSS